MRPGDRRVHPRSLGLLVSALGFVGLIRGRRVHWGSPWGSLCVCEFTGVRPGVVRFIGHRWFHWGVPWGSSGSSGVEGFSGVGCGGRRVHPGWLGALGCVRCGSSEFAGFAGLRPWGSRDHPASLVSLGCALCVVGFIQSRWVQLGAPWGSLG